MEKLSDFLKKYRKLTGDDRDFKKIILGVFDEICHLKLKEEDISVKHSAIAIICPQIFKSDIFLKQSLILKTINEKTKLSFKELRF